MDLRSWFTGLFQRKPTPPDAPAGDILPVQDMRPRPGHIKDVSPQFVEIVWGQHVVRARQALLAQDGARRSPAPDYADWRVDGIGWTATYYPRHNKLLLQGQQAGTARAVVRKVTSRP